ncbi:unnamed protein product [Bursaphelenchus xylophilus]|uniref:(pine wood nematode) hypothetical protein n=1 Tax=Bursaphelenchus xylophilus TaxID=6326 RepID=A0A1I7SDQ0_BURXY|nr:unnamed protein product [Bursaphelenchus xylophilus]CAG9084447.1 unnamed protein product [Bursaphelenchus xylophilus]
MSDDEIWDVDHGLLVADIKNVVDGKGKKSILKTKVVKKKKSVEGSVILSDLAGAITSTKNVTNLKENLGLITPSEEKEKKTKRKSSKLSVPLHRQEQTRVQSKIAYSDVRKQLRTWDPVVQSNRAAEQLKFPLGAPETFYNEPVAEKTKSFKPRTSLELRLADALGQSNNKLDADELYTEDEKTLLKALSLKDAKERTAKLQKIRAVMSFRAAKHARDAKIKSKTYHRLRKKEQRKKVIKEIEDLLATNPDAAKEKLKELEVDRAYERATLKHRSTNKWSVQLRQYAARNPQMQQLISEHLNIGREFKKRHGMEVEEESSDDESDATKQLTKTEIINLAVDQVERDGKSNPWSKNSSIRATKATEPVEIDLQTGDVLQLEDVDNEVLNDEFLANAFDGENVVADFEKEKEDECEKTKESVKDDRLFGWGDWTGEGIDRNQEMERKQRFVKRPNKRRRVDQDNAQLIVRGSGDSEFQKLQPSDVPFPFTAVQDFEAVIRQPLGRDWNTSLSHKNLVKKAVVTKAGRIINPIKKEDLRPNDELPENEIDEIFG